MDEEKESSEKLIEIIRSQPNTEEYVEMLLSILENTDKKMVSAS